MKNWTARRKSVSVVAGRAIILATALWITAIAPPSAWAQRATSGIAGVVRDPSGGVLPGVTVEASSPALIEKTRTVITDGEGRYSAVELPPGTYAITFTLTGFTTMRREGVEVPGGFTATVNAELRVGSLEETITVSGLAPLVDATTARQQQRVTSEMLDALPVSTKALGSTMQTLTPGLKGSQFSLGASPASMGIYGSIGNGDSYYHGKAGGKDLFDGMSILNSNLEGRNVYIVSGGNVQEIVLETGGGTADSNVSGFRANVIPKEGSNQYRFAGFGLFTDDSLGTNNLDDALRNQGVTAVNKVLNAWDFSSSLGGPIKKDVLWFHWTSHLSRTNNQFANAYWNKIQGSGFYEPDLARGPAAHEDTLWSHGPRLTWQLSTKNKVTAFADTQHIVSNSVTPSIATAPEAVTVYDFFPTGLYQGTWTSTLTNRLLIEGGTSWAIMHWPLVPGPYQNSQVKPTDISIVELSTGFRYNSAVAYRTYNATNRYAQRFSVSYITGSHAFKVGLQTEEAPQKTTVVTYQDVSYSYLRGLPSSVTQYATPYTQEQRLGLDLGLYGNYRWNIGRLTLNSGLRFDYLKGYVPDQNLAATQFLPARNLEGVDCAPCWTDISPRVGASYDLFGTGKTALKASWGKYVSKTTNEISTPANPINTSVSNASRNWNDANANFKPDCDLTNFSANGECGPIGDANFGKNNPRATVVSDEVARGFGTRPYLWDISAEVQHELFSGLSLSAGYYRNWHRNLNTIYTGVLALTITQLYANTVDNLAVTPADYDPFCVTAPVDSRLPNGGGYQICGLYDVKPAKFGQVQNVWRPTEKFGKPQRSADFLNFSFDSRLNNGARIGGGIDTGRLVNDFCFVIDSPQQLLNCRIETPWLAQTEVKLHGSYPLPGDFAVAGVYQNTPGAAIDANYAVSNAQIVPSLNRSLAACGTSTNCTASVTIPLYSPQSYFAPRRSQVDLRVTKTFRLGGRIRLLGSVDAYNVFNANTTLTLISTYGSSWQRPTQILDGRLIQLSGNLYF